MNTVGASGVGTNQDKASPNPYQDLLVYPSKEKKQYQTIIVQDEKSKENEYDLNTIALVHQENHLNSNNSNQFFNNRRATSNPRTYMRSRLKQNQELRDTIQNSQSKIGGRSKSRRGGGNGGNSRQTYINNTIDEPLTAGGLQGRNSSMITYQQKQTPLGTYDVANCQQNQMYQQKNRQQVQLDPIQKQAKNDLTMYEDYQKFYANYNILKHQQLTSKERNSKATSNNNANKNNQKDIEAIMKDKLNKRYNNRKKQLNQQINQNISIQNNTNQTEQQQEENIQGGGWNKSEINNTLSSYIVTSNSNITTSALYDKLKQKGLNKDGGIGGGNFSTTRKENMKVAKIMSQNKVIPTSTYQTQRKNVKSQGKQQIQLQQQQQLEQLQKQAIQQQLKNYEQSNNSLLFNYSTNNNNQSNIIDDSFLQEYSRHNNSSMMKSKHINNERQLDSSLAIFNDYINCKHNKDDKEGENQKLQFQIQNQSNIKVNNINVIKDKMNNKLGESPPTIIKKQIMPNKLSFKAKVSNEQQQNNNNSLSFNNGSIINKARSKTQMRKRGEEIVENNLNYESFIEQNIKVKEFASSSQDSQTQKNKKEDDNLQVAQNKTESSQIRKNSEEVKYEFASQGQQKLFIVKEFQIEKKLVIVPRNRKSSQIVNNEKQQNTHKESAQQQAIQSMIDNSSLNKSQAKNNNSTMLQDRLNARYSYMHINEEDNQIDEDEEQVQTEGKQVDQDDRSPILKKIFSNEENNRNLHNQIKKQYYPVGKSSAMSTLQRIEEHKNKQFEKSLLQLKKSPFPTSNSNQSKSKNNLSRSIIFHHNKISSLLQSIGRYGDFLTKENEEDEYGDDAGRADRTIGQINEVISDEENPIENHYTEQVIIKSKFNDNHSYSNFKQGTIAKDDNSHNNRTSDQTQFTSIMYNNQFVSKAQHTGNNNNGGVGIGGVGNKCQSFQSVMLNTIGKMEKTSLLDLCSSFEKQEDKQGGKNYGNGQLHLDSQNNNNNAKKNAVDNESAVSFKKLEMSQQNALLSLLSQDDFAKLNKEIHHRFEIKHIENQIEEIPASEEEDQAMLLDDDEAVVMTSRERNILSKKKQQNKDKYKENKSKQQSYQKNMVGEDEDEDKLNFEDYEGSNNKNDDDEDNNNSNINFIEDSPKQNTKYMATKNNNNTNNQEVREDANFQKKKQKNNNFFVFDE